MAYEIKHYSTDQVASLCAQRLFELTVSAAPTLLFISGGSSMTVLQEFEKIINAAKPSLQQLTIAFADERFDPTNSNYALLLEKIPTVISSTKFLGAAWIDTRPQKKDQYEMADWYDEKIKSEMAKAKSNKGKIIMLLGMGKDGHIAGILPHPNEEQLFNELFVHTQRKIVGYNAEGKNEFPKRFTVTFPVIEQADHILGYITGEEKRDALNDALKDSPPLYESPAAFLKEPSLLCELYTDIVSL